ncbi:MAG: T9SS type A sorting domain-containing protein, partial [Bacteroidia bacterium]
GYTLNSETPKPTECLLKVIPNPSHDGFGVDLSELNLNAQQPADLQLVNLQGQLVMARRLQGGYSQLQWVSTHSLEPGVYIVNVRQNADLYSQKIVIY